jgi:transposase
MKIPMIEPTSRPVGAAPLFRQLADEIGVVSIVNTLVAWDPRQCRVSPGERILLMMLDILAGKTPLYRLAERLTTTDVEILVGQGRRPEDFTDDSLGRALDKLHRAGPAKVFSAWALAAYAHDGITLETGHFDTTSRSVAGAFAEMEGPGVHPAYGYSKDHRPDLKQILMTLFVNREGVPLFGTVESGHRSDKTLNAEMIDRLVQALTPEQLRDLIYVADSALVTGPNLAQLESAGIRFVSRCPETFAAVAAAKAAAGAADAWIPVGRLAIRADGATYWASEQSGIIDGRTYRLVVYRSSAGDPRAQRAVDRAIAAERDTLERTARTLAAETFACAADAQAALDRWQATAAEGWHTVSGTVVSRTHQTRRGRPRKTAAATETITTWHVVPIVDAVDATRRQRAIAHRSAFVLITTVPADRLSAAELLAEYKGQVHVERHFHFLKDPLFVDALFVKKPERLEALGYVLLGACLLYSLAERRLRRSGIPIPSPSRRVLTRPTGHELIRHLQSVHIARDAATGARVIALPTIYHPTLQAICEALQMPPTVFTEPPVRAGPP